MDLACIGDKGKNRLRVAEAGCCCLLFATMMESKCCRLETSGYFTQAGCQFFVLEAARLAPSGEVLVQLGVVYAGHFRHFFHVEEVKMVEEGADVVFEREFVFRDLDAHFGVFFPDFAIGLKEVGNGFFGGVAISGNPKIFFFVFGVASEGAVGCHFNDGCQAFISLFHGANCVNVMLPKALKSCRGTASIFPVKGLNQMSCSLPWRTRRHPAALISLTNCFVFIISKSFLTTRQRYIKI